MGPNEVQQRFSRIGHAIHHAAACCAIAQAVLMDLKDCIQQLDQRALPARNVLQSQDENRVRDCVDELEARGDRTTDACEASIAHLDAELKIAVMQAQRALTELNHQLHLVDQSSASVVGPSE